MHDAAVAADSHVTLHYRLALADGQDHRDLRQRVLALCVVRKYDRGQVISVEVREEPGAGLGEAARRAVSAGRFSPATRSGAGIPCSFEYLYRFELL